MIKIFLKLFLVVIFILSASNTSLAQEDKNEIYIKVQDISKSCRGKTSKHNITDENNIFANEVGDEKARIECLKEHIKEYALSNYSEDHWQNIDNRLNSIEKEYISLYRTVRCPTWPYCPMSGEVFPYIDYYSLLKKLLYDMYISDQKLI